MKKLNAVWVLALVLFLQSCSAVAGVFKAGMWWGIILVFLVIGLIIFLLRGRR